LKFKFGKCVRSTVFVLILLLCASLMMVVATDNASAAPGVVDHYNVTVGGYQTAGIGFEALVEAVSSEGDLVTSATTTVHIELYIASTLIDSNAELLQSDYATPASDNQPLVGGQLTLYINDTVTEPIYISISSGGVSGASEINIINPAAIHHYIVLSSTPQIAGVGWSGTATAYDEFDNIVTTDSTTIVTMTENGDALFYASDYTTPDDTYQMSAGVATFYVKDTVAQTITLTVTDDNSISAFIAGIVVNPAPIDHFDVTVGGAPMSKMAGVSWMEPTNNVVVTAHDEFNNVVTIYTGSPAWSASCAGTLPTAQAFVLGTHTFGGSGFRLNIAGAQTITMTDGSINGTSAIITITPAAIDHYIVRSSTPQIAGVGWSGNATAYDDFDNIVTTDSTTVVTMTENGDALFYASDYTTPDDTYQMSAGVATFYVKDTVAQTLTLTATDVNSRTGNIAGIVVLPAEIDHFTMSGCPASTIAGEVFANGVIVTAYDEFDNVKTNYNGTVNWTSSDGAPYPASLPVNYTFTSGDAGVHTFAGAGFVLYTTASQTITVSDTNNSVTLTSISITVNPTAIDHYIVASSSPQVAGVGWSDIATAYDQFDNIVTTDSTTVVTMTENGDAVFYTSSSYAVEGNTYTLSAGVATFFVKDNVAQTLGLRAMDGNDKTGNITGIVVLPANISEYEIVSSTPQIAGVGWSGTVTAYDFFGNLVYTDNTSVFRMTITAPQNLMFYSDDNYTGGSNTGQYTLSEGIATYYVRDTVAETIYLYGIDLSNSISDTSDDIVVNPAAIEYYMVGPSTSQVAGVGWSGTATAYDFFGNMVTTDSLTYVNMTATGSAVFYEGDYATENNTYQLSAGVATFYVRDTVAQTITLTATDGNNKTGYISGIVINPAAIDHYHVVSSSPQIAGVGWSGTATAHDVFHNVVTIDSTTVVTMTATGSAVFYTSITYATPGDTYTLSAGVATFYVKDNVTQTLTLTATDGNSKTGNIAGIVVLPAEIDHFTMINYPASTTAGVAFVAGVTVTAYDEFDNVKTNYNGTVNWTSSDGAPYPASLPVDYTFTSSDAGVHTFAGAGFTLYTTASQTITVSDTVLSATNTSTSITVLPAVIDHFSIEGCPIFTIAGDGFDAGVTVTAYDEFDNVKTNYNGTVNWTSSDGAPYPASLPVDYTFTSGDAGVHVFAGAGFILYTTVVQTISVSDTVDSSTISESDDIVVGPAAIHHFSMINYPAQTYAGVAFVADVTVTAYDEFDNVKTNYVGTVTWTSSDPYPASLPGDYTFVLGDAGVRTFAGADFILYTLPSQTITVSDTVDSATLTSASITMLVNDRPIDIVMDVGAIQFPGEFVTWWMMMTVNGQPFDPSGMIATLYTPELSSIDLSGEMYGINPGLWIVNWTVPGDALAGQYTLVLTVNDGFSYGGSLSTFVVSDNLVDMGARVVSMDGNVTLVQTDIGLIKLNLTAINAYIASINGTLVTIQTDIGSIQADITAINGNLTTIEGDIATIQTDIGTIQASVTSINAYIASINGTLVTIQTDIGSIQENASAMNARLTAIEGDIATIQTDIGNIQVDIADINALLVSINGTIATIQTDIGTIQENITAINGRLTSIEGNVATIQTDIGTIQVDIADINVLLVSINGTLVTIQTDIGSIQENASAMNARLTMIEGDIATIQTDIGTILANVTSINAYIASINSTLATIQTDIGTIQVDVSSINTYIASINSTLVTIQTDIGTIQENITAINGRLTSIEGNVATIRTDIGTIRVDIANIRASVVSIEGTLVTIQTDIGTIQENITAINARLTAIEGTVATVQTDIGTIQVQLAALNTTVTSIEGNVATIQTSLGTLTGTVYSIEGNVATIHTELGTMQADVSGLETETQNNNIYTLVAIVLLVITLLVCIYGLVRRRNFF